jgi:hypothetical protein
MRVYVPATLPQLAEVCANGTIEPAPVTAFAVTPALREWYVEGDLEELEYAALTEAARASLRLLDVDPTAPRRRVVLAIDVPDRYARPAPDLDRAVVRVLAPVPWASVASAHVDAPEAVPEVKAAVDNVLAADLGDDDAQFVVDGAEDHELQWWATQEVPELLREALRG